MKKYIGMDTGYSTFDSFVPAPLIRRAFSACGDGKYVLRVSTPGFYRAYVNGEEITKGFLAPYISNPDDYVYYDEYDITDRLINGENCLGFILGNGLMNDPGGHMWGFDKADWVGAPRIYAALYRNGEKVLETDENFKTAPSAILFDDYRSGEYYDARLEIPGWSKPDFNDDGWKPAAVLSSPKGEDKKCLAQPVRIRKKLIPESMISYDGGYLYDFGENSTGVCRLSLENGVPGQEITLRHGEYIRDGRLNYDNLSFEDNTPFQRSFPQKSIYICKGGKEEHIPSFVYNGFRYVYVKGITAAQATKDLLTYLVFNSELEETGNFKCADETVNGIHKMVINSDLSCFVYFPNDCPQREKNGWTCDAALSAEQTLLNFDPFASYREWLCNIRKAQAENGGLPGIIPTAGWGYCHGPGWDGIIVTMPYDIYRYTGKIEILYENAGSIWKYLKYLQEITGQNGCIDYGLGDWCDISNPVCGSAVYSSPRGFTSTVLAMYQCKCAADIYSLLGDERAKDAAALSERYRSAVRRHFIDFDSFTAVGRCQTSQAMALAYGVFDSGEKPAAEKVLLDIIKEKDDFMNCGVYGNKVLFDVLSQAGKTPLAYKMITRPEFPSFGNYVRRGFTTLPEHFTTKQREKEYRVESLNHHFWGCVDAWFYKYIAGINYNPGFNDLFFAEFRPGLDAPAESAEAKINTGIGEISVYWHKKGAAAVMNIVCPDILKYNIVLPAGYKISQTSQSVKDGIKSLTVIIN